MLPHFSHFGRDAEEKGFGLAEKTKLERNKERKGKLQCAFLWSGHKTDKYEKSKDSKVREGTAVQQSILRRTCGKENRTFGLLP